MKLLYGLMFIIGLTLINCSILSGNDKPVNSDMPLPPPRQIENNGHTNEIGKVTGTIKDLEGNLLTEAVVVISKSSVPVPEKAEISGPTGLYQWELPSGTFEVTVHKEGYETKTIPVTLKTGETLNLDFELSPIKNVNTEETDTNTETHSTPPSVPETKTSNDASSTLPEVEESDSSETTTELGKITGVIKDLEGNPLSEAVVTISKSSVPVPEKVEISGPTGLYQWVLPAGTFDVTVRKDGYDVKTVPVTLKLGETLSLDFELNLTNSNN